MSAVHTTDWTTPANLHRRFVHNGPKGVPRGRWVSDLAEHRKAIFLCFKCEHKWNPKAHDYSLRRLCGQRYVTSDCDGCGNRNVNTTCYRHLEIE